MTGNEYSVCLVWEAATTNDWTFPNPTMNGLMPGMTSQQMKNIWLNDLEFDWIDSVCDTVQLEAF